MKISSPIPTRPTARCAFLALILATPLVSCSAQETKTQEAAATPLAAPRVTLARVPDGGLQPQVVTQDGTVHLVYFKGKANAGNLFYARSQDGGVTFSPALRVNSQAGSAIAMGTIRGAQLAVGRKGRVFVVWNGSGSALPRNGATPSSLAPNGASPLLFSRLSDTGERFEAQRNVLTRSFNLDGGASVAADDEGRVYLAWHAHDKAEQDEGQRRVWLAVSEDDGQSFASEKPAWNEPTGACGCCSLRLMARNGGQVALIYRSARELVHRDSYFLESSDAGKTFRGQKLHEWNIAACPMSSYALAQSGARRLAAWESADQIYFSWLNDAGRATSIQSPPGRSPRRKHPALAVGAGGETLLAWTQGTGWNRGGKMQWQLLDAQGRAVEPQGTQDGVPTWSFGAPIPRPDGGFTLLY